MIRQTFPPIFALILAAYSAFGASEAQEKAIWALWDLQTNVPSQPEAVVAAYRQIQKTAPDNSFLPVYQGLAAWSNLRQEKTNEAIAILNDMAAATAPAHLPAVGAEMARRWLTRLDREKVRAALAIYYRRAIDYPINLQALKKTTKDALPLTDRWGTPWQYRLAEFKIVKNTRGQRYLLQSKTLMESSDLAAALARPYADRIVLRPQTFAITSGGAQTVAFQTIDDRPDKILLSEGGSAAGITLAYIGARVLIVCDGDHWRLFPKP